MRVLLAVILALGASACGQRGDLFLRENPPPGYKSPSEVYKPVPYPEDDAADFGRRK
jgi:hypothetical protein